MSDVAMIKPLQCACVQTLLCRFALYLAWLLFTVVFLWRLTLGVDHSDESYYAIAPVSWTRSNPVDTGNFSIHQFSGCITYPLIQAYAWITPSLHGLILFLRCLYAIASFTTAYCAWRLLRHHFPSPCSVFISMSIALFIPFGLPAPSYNTLGALGCLSSLFLVLALLDERRRQIRHQICSHDLLICFASSVALAVGIVSHPILLFLFPIMGLSLVIAYRNDLRILVIWAFFVSAIGLFIGLLAIHHLGGPSRIRAMLAFVGSFDNTLGIVAKANLAIALLCKDQAYCLTLAILLIFGCIRAIYPTRLVSLGNSLALIIASIWCVVRWTGTPVLFGRGHDLVFLLTAASLPDLIALGFRKTAISPVFVIVFATGISGGILIGASATHALYNFPLLGIACVVAGFGMRARFQCRANALAETFLAAVICSMLSFASYQQVYGEGIGTHVLTIRIKHGPFAGLLTRPAKAKLMARMDAAIQSIPNQVQTVDCFGRFPGIYLHTAYELRSPFPYPLEEQLTTRTVPLLEQWYANESFKPDAIIWFRDAFRLELNHVQTQFAADNYQKIHDDKQGLTVYARLLSKFGAITQDSPSGGSASHGSDVPPTD